MAASSPNSLSGIKSIELVCFDELDLPDSTLSSPNNEPDTRFLPLAVEVDVDVDVSPSWLAWSDDVLVMLPPMGPVQL